MITESRTLFRAFRFRDGPFDAPAPSSIWSDDCHVIANGISRTAVRLKERQKEGRDREIEREREREREKTRYMNY